MPSLLDRRLLIFSGKGGAGKSIVAAATAVAAARHGKRVLIVEIGEEERIPALFGSAKRAGYAGSQVRAPRPGVPPVWSMCVTGREALREFALRSMKFELFYDAVFENPAARLFMAAAPGLDELTIMGKIEFLHRESVAPAKHARFDIMIFDAPATGQGLAFFKVPLMAMSMAPIGPLRAKAERMWRLVADPVRTAFNIVTLPEEMSVNEAIDLHRASSEMGLPRGAVIVNGVWPDFFAGDEAALARAREGRVSGDLSGRIARAALDAAASSVVRRQAQMEMVAKLAEGLPLERTVLPFLPCARIGPAELETLADSLEPL
ncbi:MAG TPA: ArsA-related P-loop ATPase [Vicinamibacterales bacterium]|nr:ArsA-related P-loop ATPase [Vicinamibacterales bacterium]